MDKARSVFLLVTYCIVMGFIPQIVKPVMARASEAALTVRLSTQFPPQSPIFRSIAHFQTEVERLSGGRARVETHASGELHSDAQVGPAVSSGAIEMGVSALYRWADAVPAADFFQLPFMFNTAELEERAAARGGEIRTLIDDAILKQTGARVLWWISAGRTQLLSKGEAVTAPDKIVGKTVRTAGPVANAFVAKCGGRPKDIRGKDLEKALAAHEVDMAISTAALIGARQLWRFMDTVTRTQHASWQFVAVINEKYWRSLRSEDRTVIETAAREAEAEARRAISEVEANTYGELAAKRGMKVAELSQEELQLWRICSSGVLEQYLRDAGPLGGDLMHAYGRLRLQAPSEAPIARAPGESNRDVAAR